jgi:hypothetical protein
VHNHVLLGEELLAGLLLGILVIIVPRLPIDIFLKEVFILELSINEADFFLLLITFIFV